MKVRIMRGLPGSGKTYFGEVILPRICKAERVAVCSADKFFVGDDGVYRFDPKKLAKAHESCRRDFLDALQEGHDLVTVDNTNTMPTEIAFYYDLATLFTDDIQILAIEPPPVMEHKDWLNQCFKLNSHSVPMKSIQAMSDRMKKHKLPWYWKVRQVTREDGFFVLNGQTHEV